MKRASCTICWSRHRRATRASVNACSTLPSTGCVNRECRVVLWTASPNDSARRLFEGRGFRSTMIEMTLELEGDSRPRARSPRRVALPPGLKTRRGSEGSWQVADLVRPRIRIAQCFN